MLTTVKTDKLTIRGVSLGGVYTSLFVPELDALFDLGIPARSAAAANFIFISHGHVDHVGALFSHLGIRALTGKSSAPTLYLPSEILEEVEESLRVMTKIQRYDLKIQAVPMNPGDVAPMRGDIEVRAIRTHHGVPSLGYSLVRKIKKLRDEFLGLPGQDIAERKRRGEDLFRIEERTEISYCTDTLIQVLDNNPGLYESRVLVLECTFLDERKSLEASRAGCHIHLDEILERADKFQNESLVLMHFSQLYKPDEVREILDRRCPPDLRKRIVPFAPGGNRWPG
jgi:ribonuclease Z